MSNQSNCRFCSTELKHTFVDLGTAPLCQKHVTPARYNEAERIYPQHVYVCDQCFLVQLPAYVAPEEIFDSEYGYFSGFSASWLKHCSDYVEMVTSRFNLDHSSKVVEIASNDGSLLQYFQAKGVPCLGIEPTQNTADAAIARGIPTLSVFFTRQNARKLVAAYGKQDLILGNNVLAHVPDINDFVQGMKTLLADNGVITMEFPVVSKLIENNLWDTIYHEHFSYLSFQTVYGIFAAHGLQVFDVEELPTHGGSIRIFARHMDCPAHPVTLNVFRLAVRESATRNLEYYTSFAQKVAFSKHDILEWFLDKKIHGQKIAGYGAPGKGNTLLNYCGIRSDFMDFVVDDSPHKQGNFLPGSRIPILHPDEIARQKPDYVVIMPWNWKDEIAAKLGFIKEWGGQCVVLLPKVEAV